jgi:lipid-A-disaccharide synthase
LSAAVELLLKNTPERRAQVKALATIADRMQPVGGAPSEIAAETILRVIAQER